MATISGGDKLEAALADLSKKVNRPAVLQVGFMEGAAYPDGTPVALVAAINEYGRPSIGQPPRPFFRRAIAAHASEWAGELATLLRANDYDPGPALEVQGRVIQGEIKQSISDLTDPPLKPSTVKAKGFSKPLIDTGYMLNSVTYRVKLS
jgi:hypothetical protein